MPNPRIEFTPSAKDSSDTFRQGLRKVLPLSQRFVEYVHRTQAMKLFLFFLFVYFGAVLFFAVLYWGTGAVYYTKSGAVVDKFSVCIYFSIACQTTVAFGDVIPAGLVKGVASFQAVFGTILFAFATGLTLAKIVTPGVPIQLSKKIVFYPKDKAFRVRARVLASDNMPKWLSTMAVRELERTGASHYAAQKFPVLRLNYDEYNAEPGKAYLLPTIPLTCISEDMGAPPLYASRLCSVPKDKIISKDWRQLSSCVSGVANMLMEAIPRASQTQPVVLTPVNMHVFTDLTITMKYHLNGVLKSGMLCHSYNFPNDVDCGEFMNVVYREGGDRSLIKCIDHSCFEGVDQSPPAACKVCEFVVGCTILRSRAEKGEKEYQKIVEEQQS